MELKAELYRDNAARWERRAENERGQNARKWQLTVARVYGILATEAESAVQHVTAAKPVFSRSCWFAPNSERLETAERYVLDGCRIVTEQRGKVSQLKDQGHHSAEAEKTLKLLEKCLMQFENQLKLLQLPSNPTTGFIF
jgi:hypothetical protein